MTITLLQGDNRAILPTLPEKSVQCCITSPPYFGLRRYDVEGAQIGMEDTPAAYVAALVDVFREVRRVLRDDGTVWVNLGDSYSGGKSGRDDDGPADLARRAERYHTGVPKAAAKGANGVPRKPPEGMMSKQLLGIPWMVAFALRDDGWYLRSAITWCKGNPMPESVRDRPTSATEMIFLLAKQPRYFYDGDAIAEQAAQAGRNDDFARPSRTARAVDVTPSGNEAGGRWVNPGTRNRRNWWVVNSQPLAIAHFATWPEKLVEPMVLAGSSPRACDVCGAPWERVVETGMSSWEQRKADGAPMRYGENGHQQKHTLSDDEHRAYSGLGKPAERVTVGWRPTCRCPNEGAARCVVLDPFCGSGTTMRVSERYGRDSIGIDLGYLDLAEKRTDGVQIDMESLL